MVATLTEREELYRGAAHHTIDTNEKSPNQITDEIVSILKEQYGLEYGNI